MSQHQNPTSNRSEPHKSVHASGWIFAIRIHSEDPPNSWLFSIAHVSVVYRLSERTLLCQQLEERGHCCNLCSTRRIFAKIVQLHWGRLKGMKHEEFRVENEIGNLLNDYAEVGSCSMRSGARTRGCFLSIDWIIK